MDEKITESESNYDDLEKMEVIDLLSNINREDKNSCKLNRKGYPPKLKAW